MREGKGPEGSHHHSAVLGLSTYIVDVLLKEIVIMSSTCQNKRHINSISHTTEEQQKKILG